LEWSFIALISSFIDPKENLISNPDRPKLLHLVVSMSKKMRSEWFYQAIEGKLGDERIRGFAT